MAFAVARAKEVGKVGTETFYLVPCLDCKKERWVPRRHGELKSQRCHSCASKTRHGYAMEENGNWRGGRRIQKSGYVVRTIPNDHPYRSMASKHRIVREHRLIMAEYLHRPLRTNEVVHHINGIRADNRIENLMLTTRMTHDTRALIKAQQERIQELEKQLAHYKEAYFGV